MDYISYVTEVLENILIFFYPGSSLLCPYCTTFFSKPICCRVQIHDEDVSLRVDKEFHRTYLGEPLDVEFTFNRYMCVGERLASLQVMFLSRGLHVLWSFSYCFLCRLTMRRCHLAVNQTKNFGENGVPGLHWV